MSPYLISHCPKRFITVQKKICLFNSWPKAQYLKNLVGISTDKQFLISWIFDISYRNESFSLKSVNFLKFLRSKMSLVWKVLPYYFFESTQKNSSNFMTTRCFKSVSLIIYLFKHMKFGYVYMWCLPIFSILPNNQIFYINQEKQLIV